MITRRNIFQSLIAAPVGIIAAKTIPAKNSKFNHVGHNSPKWMYDFGLTPDNHGLHLLIVTNSTRDSFKEIAQVVVREHSKLGAAVSFCLDGLQTEPDKSIENGESFVTDINRLCFAFSDFALVNKCLIRDKTFQLTLANNPKDTATLNVAKFCKTMNIINFRDC